MDRTSASDEMLEELQRDTCSYFLKHTSRATGLVQDKAR